MKIFCEFKALYTQSIIFIYANKVFDKAFLAPFTVGFSTSKSWGYLKCVFVIRLHVSSVSIFNLRLYT